ncbi:MAG TPA: GGDEF domain-containing protein [Syntrophales bacterium]|nr:GGDEF domain-containing protein [Syntrophales bacterium]
MEQVVPLDTQLFDVLRLESDDTTADFIASVQVRPHFHPIVDLFTGAIIGFEILSRGVPPFESPDKMFRQAAEIGATWDLEMACCDAALAKIASLQESSNRWKYFINVSPAVFSDQRFISRFTESYIRNYGIDCCQIVIEITEEKRINDCDAFERQIANYAGRGFHIALDDFGSGHSGLITLIASTPHFLKLDMAVVRDIHKHYYKQNLVQAIVSFASSVNIGLIAEGVECMEELDILVRYGVRYAQGFLFGTPQPEPYGLSIDWKTRLEHLVKKYDPSALESDATIGNLVTCPETIQRHTMQCMHLDLVFKKRPHVDHVVVLDGYSVAGLITRQHFYLKTGGAFGYDLFKKKQVETVCKSNPLCVGERISITTLAKLAMERASEDLYDPVLVVDGTGRFLGTVTLKQVLTKSIELEIHSAIGLNPLTGLPGNNVINRWIHDTLFGKEYMILYFDLDQFKAYNDLYGFLMGDELLRFTARTLVQWANRLEIPAKVGHVGGDDFVIVSPAIICESTLDELCKTFDADKLEFFKKEDVERGFVEVDDRRGNPARMPLVTLSIAVIDSTKMSGDTHPALFSELAASLKKKIKQKTYETGKSGYLYERRIRQE